VTAQLQAVSAGVARSRDGIQPVQYLVRLAVVAITYWVAARL